MKNRVFCPGPEVVTISDKYCNVSDASSPAYMLAHLIMGRDTCESSYLFIRLFGKGNETEREYAIPQIEVAGRVSFNCT